MRFRQDSRAEERGERLRCHEFNPSAEAVFKEFGQRKKTTVRLRPRRELNEEVHIALRTCLTPQNRAKESEPRHPQRADLSFALGQPVNSLLAGKNRSMHPHSVSVIGLGANKMTERRQVSAAVAHDFAATVSCKLVDSPFTESDAS